MTFCGIFVILTALLSGTVDAAVVSRSKGNSTTKTTQRVSRAQTASKTKTTTEKNPAPTEKAIETETVATPEETVVEEIVEEEIIENKSNQFDNVLSDATTGDTDNSRNALAEEIRAQRAKLDAADAASTAKNATLNALASGKSSCDQNLRACMKSKCGNDFSKCAGDTDTAWGTKMDACRRDLNCTGEEYRLFATEIKADRDMNARVASYNAIVDCGNRYNDCIISECGTKFTKCLGKKNGDTAISKCEKIAKNCTEQDSGLASRVMNVFGTLRLGAEEKVSTDQERLYAMRDAMRDTCKRLGAMFDDRTLDCVYTINFFAGEDNTLYASKKAYAGTTFNCHQNWFGIDLTTFKENAFRLTRAQTSASSAMLGAGLGTAVGAVTSGALERSIERQEAEQRAKNGGKTDAELRREERAEKKAERQEERDAKKAERQEERDAKKAERQEERAAKKAERQEERDAKKAERETEKHAEAEQKCFESGGTGLDADGKCLCSAAQGLETKGNKCVQTKAAKQQQKECEANNGVWENGNCIENDTPDINTPNAREQRQAARQAERQASAEQQCTQSGGTGLDADGKCVCSAAQGLETKGNKCVQTKAAKQQQKECEANNGVWENGNCIGDFAPDIQTERQRSCEMVNGNWRNNKCHNAQCPNNTVWSDSVYACVDNSQNIVTYEQINKQSQQQAIEQVIEYLNKQNK